MGGDWARPLAALLEDDPTLALVAPRVRGAEEAGRLARWERIASPLDMGGEGGLVGPGRRISYLPSAALVARRSALAELGGFDPGLRFGEDVDLVWRAVAAGWSVRYSPEVDVEHPARPTLAARARQHHGYGTSAPALERRHPGAVSPLRPTRLTIAPALLAAGLPAAAFLAAIALSAQAVAKQPADARLATARLLLASNLDSTRNLARALARDYLPLTVAAALVSRRARRPALVALAADLALATAPDPRRAAANASLRLTDNLAYASGLWRSAIADRSAGALVPTPGRRPGAAGRGRAGRRP